MKKTRHNSFQLLLLFTVLLLSGKANAQKEVGVYYSNWFSFPTNWTNTGGCVWAEPALGWYESNDNNVIDQHTEWLVEANVDFVIFDFSNNCGTEDGDRSKNHHLWAIEDNAMAFVDRQVWRKQNGLSYIKYAVFLGGCGNDANFTNGFFINKGNQIRDYYLIDANKRELYYKINDKPFLGIWGPENLTPNVSHPDFHCQKIGTGLGAHNSRYNKSTYWSWEEHVTPGYSMHNGEPECMTVQAALRGTGAAPNVLPQYPDGLPGWLNDGSVFGNYTVPRNNGQTFRNQLDQAIDADVRIILVQSFNEWTGCPHNPGEEMDPERSNDIEPMKDGHGDLYIQILKQKTRIFKGLCEHDVIHVEPIGSVVNDSIIELNASSVSGIPVSFEIITGPAVVEGNRAFMMQSHGKVTIRAYHDGNENICAADKLIIFDISNDCAEQTILFNHIDDQTISRDTISLKGSSDSGLPVKFEVRSGPAYMISDTKIRLSGIEGEVIIEASQPGDFTYCEAQRVIRSFKVAMPPHDCNDCLGYITYERWDNIVGGAVDLIPVDTEPDFLGVLNLLETPKNIGDFYGTRLSGYLCVPYTGEYTFYIAGDDGCQFWMSSDENMENKKLIAYVNDWTHYRDWYAFPSQKSDIMQLTGGQKHYIEVLLKENNGEDHVSIRWVGPNNLDDIVSGKFLDPICVFQEINFSPVANQVADSLFVLNAISNSGLPVEFDVYSGPAVIYGDTLKVLENRKRIIITASQSGDSQYCKAPSTNQVFMLSIDSSTSTDIISLKESITIFPNPTNGIVYIKWERQNDSEKINHLEVIDATGRVVFAKSDSFTDHNMIDLNSFGSGLYYFRIITTYGAVTKMIAKTTP